MAMMLVDEGLLDLDKPVRAFLPQFRGGAKDTVTVRQLLTHSSGIDWWAPLYKELTGRPAYVERIQKMDLAYEPGTKSLYSDLGLVLLGEILERVAGESIDAFARRRISGPLGMKDTQYAPPAALARPHRADREGPLARAGRAGRGARRERVRDGRRRAARGPLRDRAGPGALRADARERRRLRQSAIRLA